MRASTVLYEPSRHAGAREIAEMSTTKKMLIDGKWTDASNGATYAVPNPATEEPVGSAPDATVDDMRRAIAAARRAFDEGPWPRSSRQDRARALLPAAAAMGSGT